MTDRARILADIAEVADELTDARKHNEPVYTDTPARHKKLTHAWTTTQAGLLAQLREAIVPGAAEVLSGSKRTRREGSPAPLQVEALSRYAVIEVGVLRWCWSLRLEIRDTVESNVRGLVGAAGSMDGDTQLALLVELRRWLTWCKVLTGWQSPLFRPNAPCPHCEQRGTLRVNLTRKAAFCVTKIWDPERTEYVWCATWDASTIGVLAEHIRASMEAA